jgi:hypothetical protein
VSNIDKEIAAIKTRIENAQLAKARAQVNKEAAQNKIDETLELLRTKFGVDNTQDARGKLEQLQATLAEKKTEVATILDRYDL